MILPKRCYLTNLGIVAMLIFTASPSRASLIQVSSVAGLLTVNDSINWAALGADLTPLSPPVAVTTTAGRAATLTGSTAFTLFSGSTYNADFLPGNLVVSAYDLNNGPLSTGIRILLPFLVNGLGTQIQANTFGAFSGTLQAFDANSVSLGTVSVSSSVLGNGDGSAVFLGAYSTGSAIGSVLFTSNIAGVAINNVALGAIPEPSTIYLALSAIVAFSVRRKAAKNAAENAGMAA